MERSVHGSSSFLMPLVSSSQAPLIVLIEAQQHIDFFLKGCNSLIQERFTILDRCALKKIWVKLFLIVSHGFSHEIVAFDLSRFEFGYILCAAILYASVGVMYKSARRLGVCQGLLEGPQTPSLLQ